MSLDADAPPPPTLATVDPSQYDDTEVAGDEYHREELESFLAAGAWETAFDRWSAGADIDADVWRIAGELELFGRFDFFWDDFADRVGYHAPGIPEDWKERDLHPDLHSWAQVSAINAALTEFGQVVCEVLKEEYVDWESEFEAPDDLPDF